MVLNFCFTCLLFVFFSHVEIRIYISFLCFNAMNTYSHVHTLIPWVLWCSKVSKVSHAFTYTCILFVILFRIDEHDIMNKHVMFLMFSMISWRCHILFITYCEIAPPALFYGVLSQTHVNGWSRVIATQNGGSTNYIFPFRLRILQWSRYLFNYLNK